MKYFLISVIPLFMYVILDTIKGLHMLQQNWYNLGGRYVKWIANNSKKVFLSYDYLYIFIFLLSLVLKNNILMYIIFFYYLIITLILNNNQKKEIVKKPLDITSRIKRLMITIFILYFITVFFICINYNEELLNIYYLILGTLVYLNYYVICLANTINIPIEKLVYLYYKTKALNKLKKMNQMEVIGITGSYGKTSTKNALNEILNEKYISFKTPKNFNTNYGLIRTINEYIDKYNNYFVAELGAFKKGDIKSRCKIVKPKYGILTKIGEAHLESFKSQENIIKGKFELIESLPNDGIAILNKDDINQVNYKLNNKCKVLWYAIKDKTADICADNIKYSSKGMEFDVIINNKKETFKTKLLGEANIYNILASLTLANELGLSIEEMQRGVFKIRPVEHRLELKNYGNINYIDDAYNSNPEGSKMAVEVLGLMPGKKIVITPGMIELGEKQYEYNYNFGKYISKVADLTILVGSEQTKPIYDGLIDSNYNKDKLIVLNDVKEAIRIAQNYFKDNVYILLENDLPDMFNE